jgi:uncharacterized membrane protein YdjX (TVP38/TMEM64 family)
MFLEMRREAVVRGHGIFPEHRGLVRFERTGMSRRFTWYALPDGCESVLFPGCSFPGTRPARTRELFEQLRERDRHLGIVLDCCGRISSDLGKEHFARSMMEEMSSFLMSHGVREVLVVCPNCHDMFKTYGTGLSVRTVYEVLPARKTAPVRGGEKLVLHDPCGARFHDACHASVRRLVASAGIAVEDMAHAQERTLCCGNGAGIDSFSPDLADQWLRRTAGEAGGRTIATYCAGCAGTLNTRSRAVHLLDVLSEPSAALTGKVRASRGLATFLNRLCLKRHFRKTVDARVTRERTFSAGEGGKKSGVWRLLVAAAVVAAIAAVRMTGVSGSLDRESLQGFIEGYGALAPIIYILVYTLAPALLLPGLPITIAGGILFGPLWGVLYTITGSTMGACLAFLISRYAARGWIEDHLQSPRWRSLDEGVERHGWKVVALTRLIPLLPFNLLNYAFGLTKIGFVPYAVASFVFMLPACIAFIVFSNSLLDLLQGNVSAGLIIGLLLVVLVSLLPAGYRVYRSRGKNADPW